VKNKDIYILLGTNLGQREVNLLRAIERINQEVGNIVAQSSVLETEPWGFEANQNFLNQALKIECNCSPYDLLLRLKRLEQELGRAAKTINGYESRIIDIDILFFAQEVLSSPDLVIPHPQIQHRFFALKPLSEIAAHFIHPVLGKSVETMLKEIVSR
jgi:2-amino-4-hydroxy-6-hydroxymethyldihydropteridine diphosphokinase